MNRLFFTLVLISSLLLLPGCSGQDTPAPITTVTPDTDSNISIVYPELHSANANVDKLRQLLDNQVSQWIDSHFAPDSVIELQGSITLQNDSLLCILFEGDAAAPETAHPSRIAFSVCVDPQLLTIVDPVLAESMDEGFVTRLLSQLSTQQDPNYSPAHWTPITDYVNGLSVDELTAMIADSPIALSADGIIVCLNVPHAIGDYVKITVPVD